MKVYLRIDFFIKPCLFSASFSRPYVLGLLKNYLAE